MNRKFLIMLVAGLAAIAVGILQLRVLFTPSGETTATITRIESELVASDLDDEEEQMRVYVDYTVDGTRYQDVLLDSYHVGMDVGDEVTVKYALSDPSQIHTGGAAISAVVFLIAGAGLTLYGGGRMVWTLRGVRRG